MVQETGAMLVAEIGSTTTRVTLIDTVDGETRLIGQAEVPSTVEPPHANAAVAILDAASRLSDTTGRRLLQDGNLLIPQTNERDGIDGVIAVTSAAGAMKLVVAAVSSDVSARSAVHASRAAYSNVLQVISLNDQENERLGRDLSWIERQMQGLLGLRPDVVLLAGGLEDGAESALIRLAHMIGLAATATREEGDGIGQAAPVRVVFAGNSQSRDQVLGALSTHTEPVIVDNLRPSLDEARLEPARRALAQAYDDRILPQLPGMASLRRLSAKPVRTTQTVSTVMARFLSERNDRDVLMLDIGSMNTSATLVRSGTPAPAVFGGVGTGYGAGAVLAGRGAAALLRWLPFPLDEQELVHRVLNKMLRPHVIPSTREDLLLEHALAREALAMAMAPLHDEQPDAPYDLVVASGGVLAHAPHPGLALLTILDALQPTGARLTRAIDIYVDTLGLMPVCGALAYDYADAALTIFDRDLLRNTPLATVVVPIGKGTPGKVAVEAELQVVGGGTQTITVNHGQIGRLPLQPGRKAQLTLKPASGVRIGANPPGAVVPTNPADIQGSALGVVIDARGRPFGLAADPLTRQQALWEWLVTLGVEQGALPYDAAAPLPESSPEIVLAPEPVAPVSAPAPEPEVQQIRGSDPSVNVVDRDLAKLRQTVEEPQKRGLFGRKK